MSRGGSRSRRRAGGRGQRRRASPCSQRGDKGPEPARPRASCRADRSRRSRIPSSHGARVFTAAGSTRGVTVERADSARGMSLAYCGERGRGRRVSPVLGSGPALQLRRDPLTVSRCRRVSGAGRWAGSGPVMVHAASGSSSLCPPFSTTCWPPSGPALVFARKLSSRLRRGSHHIRRGPRNASPLIGLCRMLQGSPCAAIRRSTHTTSIGMSRSSLRRRGGVRGAAGSTRLSRASGFASGVPSSG